MNVERDIKTAFIESAVKSKNKCFKTFGDFALKCIFTHLLKLFLYHAPQRYLLKLNQSANTVAQIQYGLVWHLENNHAAFEEKRKEFM